MLGGVVRNRRMRFVALLATLGLVAGACSSGDGDEGAGTGGGGRVRAGSSDCTFSDPAHGGKVIFGLEADTGSPWTPANAQMAIAGHMVAKAVYDNLTLLGADGEAKPGLATSWESNDDYTEWTFTIRDGVTFHDGTALDGEAVADNLNRIRASFLTGSFVRDFASVTADGQTVTITLERPLAQVPLMFTGQVGYIASPTWLAEVDEDPAKALEPVGSGPYRYKSYTPGNGNSFVAECNPDYWREGMPQLDEVEFRVLQDIQSRANALISREIDLMHTANADEIAKFRERTDEFGLVEVTDVRETLYVLLNNAPEVSLAAGEEPEANPLADARVRRAMAFATDNETLIKARGAGIVPNANGPFPPGTLGYLEETGYPEYDPDAARELVDEWEAENGDLEVAYATTADPFNRVTATLLQQMWEEVGIETTIDTVEQAQFITQALTGNFQAFGWRNHGRPDPVQEEFWWSSETATPSPGIALNFGRIADDVIDEQLTILRESDDPAERKEAAEALNRRMGEQAVNLWTSWSIWAIVANPNLSNPAGASYTSPEGDELTVYGNGQVASYWLTETHWAEG